MTILCIIIVIVITIHKRKGTYTPVFVTLSTNDGDMPKNYFVCVCSYVNQNDDPRYITNNFYKCT